MTSTPPLLAVDGLCAGYGGSLAIKDVTVRVDAGEIVALLGPNGAGKSTTMLTVAGALPAAAGEVRLDGTRLRGPVHRRAASGIAVVTEGRSVITTLSVRANLRLGKSRLDRALELFPELEPLLARRGGLLSGGEQQILSLARALSWGPRLLVVDELSLGLAPRVTARLFECLRRSADAGAGVLVVEQHARQCLGFADRAYVMQAGRVRLEGPAGELAQRFDEIEATYFRAGPPP